MKDFNFIDMIVRHYGARHLKPTNLWSIRRKMFEQLSNLKRNAQAQKPQQVLVTVKPAGTM